MTIPVPDVEMHLVRTPEDVEGFMQWLQRTLQDHEPIAIDTETTGLQWWTHAFTRLVQFGTDREGYAIPVRWWGKVIEHAMTLIRDSNVLVIMQNAPFDVHALRQEGYPLPHWANVHDTKLLLHLRQSNKSSSLKGRQTADILGNWIFRGQGALRAAAQGLGLSPSDMWAHIPVDHPAYWGYGVADTILTRILWDHLQDVRQEFHDAYERERRYQAIIFRAEERGILVDTPAARRVGEAFSKRAEELLFYLQQQGIPNPNSNQQVLALLETDYQFVPEKFTETGQPALDKHVLADLANAGGMQAEVVTALVEYKRVTKWKSSYIDVFLNNQDHHGRVHPSVNTLGARTGRSSIRNPALQTLPSGEHVIRSCMLPNPGEAWWSIDYSNQEPRALAYYGQSPALRELFLTGGDQSVHDFVAERLYGGSYTKEQRSVAKMFGLARTYGAGADTIARQGGLPIHSVQAALPEYDTLVGLDRLFDQCYAVAADRQPEPWIMTAGGRRVYADEGMEYTLVNYLIQGSAADGLKEAVCWLDDEGLADHILVPVHDEITFSFPKGEDALPEQAAKIMSEAHESLMPGIPFPCDIEGPGRSWGALYDE